MNNDHPTPAELEAYSLADLAVSARREVSIHLQACPDCRQTVASLQAVLTDYRSTPHPSPDERCLDRLLWVQRARAASRWTEPLRRLARVAAATAAAVLIYLGGFWTGRGQDTAQAPAGPPAARPASSSEAPPQVVPSALDPSPPPVSFAVAEVDRLGRLAFRDTTWH
jgi:anti-sigma factor RsiW